MRRRRKYLLSPFALCFCEICSFHVWTLQRVQEIARKSRRAVDGPRVGTEAQEPLVMKIRRRQRSVVGDSERRCMAKRQKPTSASGSAADPGLTRLAGAEGRSLAHCSPSSTSEAFHSIFL